MEKKKEINWKIVFLAGLTALCCIADFIVIKAAWAPYSAEGGVVIVSLILAGLLDIPAAFLGSGIKKRRQGLSCRGEVIPWVVIIVLALSAYILLRVFSAKEQTDAYGVTNEAMSRVSAFASSVLPVGTSVLSVAAGFFFSDPLGKLIKEKEKIKDDAERTLRDAEASLEALFPEVSAPQRLSAYDEIDRKNQENKIGEALDLALEAESYVRQSLMKICNDPAASSYLSKSRRAEVISKITAACSNEV